MPPSSRQRRALVEPSQARDGQVDSIPTAPISLPPVDRRDQKRPLFIVTAGADAGRIIPIDEPLFSIGRSTECAVQVDDRALSRVHATILCFDGDVVFADAQSTNGSLINRVPVRDPVRLESGDRVQLGDSTTLMFTIASDEEVDALVAAYQGSLRDPLTGLYNRRFMDQTLDAEIKLAHRKQLPLSILLLDLDHFKQVNDQYGHVAGDEVLRRAAAVLAAGIRTEDVLARFGGEEFLVIARATNLTHANIVAERLRELIETTRFDWGGHSIDVTVSVGVATLQGAASPEGLIAEADKRLYAAKQERNRVVGG